MIIIEALHNPHCTDPDFPNLLGTNGPTGRQHLATSRNDCHHVVSEELEIPSAKTVQVGYYDPHANLPQRAPCRHLHESETCLNCWEQMDRLADNILQQAGTIVTMSSLRNWRSQAQKQCKWGTMILTQNFHSVHRADISTNPKPA